MSKSEYIGNFHGRSVAFLLAACGRRSLDHYVLSGGEASCNQSGPGVPVVDVTYCPIDDQTNLQPDQESDYPSNKKRLQVEEVESGRSSITLKQSAKGEIYFDVKIYFLANDEDPRTAVDRIRQTFDLMNHSFPMALSAQSQAK